MILVLLALGCSGERLSREEMMDPAACQRCHAEHYQEWSGSMHAYASEDPVFRAMNERGQRETNGELGDFCVQCHAPLAVREGYTDDGLNLDDVPEHMHGVTCYFCHQVVEVEGTHNNPLVLADDRTMRGGISDPVKPHAHKVEYSILHDRNEPESSEMCGSCHDIVNGNGAHIERTFSEWQGSLFALPLAMFALNCGQCHMRGRDGVAADYPGVPQRRIHSHTMPGVDLAFTAFPEKEAQLDLVSGFLDTSVFPRLCVEPEPDGDTEMFVDLENVAAGHGFPSGASADRRVWVELTAYEQDTQVFETGVVGDSEALPTDDPDLWRIHDTLLDDDGDPVHMFWEAYDYDGVMLPAPTALNPDDPNWIDTHQRRTWVLPGEPDRVEMVVHVRPMGLDFLDDLIDSGDLDPTLRDEVPTFDLRFTQLVWTREDATTDLDGFDCVP